MSTLVESKPSNAQSDETPDTTVGIEASQRATDLDASLRFAEANEKILNYCPGIGWLHWNKSRWAVNDDGLALEYAKRAALNWTRKWERSRDENRATRLKEALVLEGGSHLRAVVALAQVDRRLVRNVDQYDSDKWLLNVANGTIDLRNGKLQPHDRENRITKLAPVTFSPGAKHPVLDRYLATLDEKTPGMSEFLARCFGTALTGDASTESIFLLQGEGGSGKTTLIEAFAAMLGGGYAVKLPFSSFCLSKHGRGPGAASPDLMPLRGARLAYADEGDQSARLDAGMVKMLTGNEPITARGLYSDPITFEQSWKLWLISNYDPNTDSDDTGMWRRMLKLQFQVIPEKDRDHEIKRTLVNNPEARSALLAWCLTGCLDWQARGGGRKGLAPPEFIESATALYRDKQDTLAEWWDELCTEIIFENAGFTTKDFVRSHYEEWCRAEGAMPVQRRRFKAYLEGKGLVDGRGTGGVKGWRGIKRNEKEPVSAYQERAYR